MILNTIPATTTKTITATTLSHFKRSLSSFDLKYTQTHSRCHYQKPNERLIYLCFSLMQLRTFTSKGTSATLKQSTEIIFAPPFNNQISKG